MDTEVGQVSESSAPVSAGTPEAPSAPQSNRDIVANAIQVAENPTPEPVKEPEPVKLSPAGEFLVSKGHRFKRDDGRDTWLKIDTVEKMLEAYHGQHRSGWDEERGSISRERDQYRTTVESLLAGARDGDPTEFIQMLAREVNPKFAAFIQQQAQAQAQSGIPEPDIDLGNGSKTWSPDGVKALVGHLVTSALTEHQKAQAEKEAKVKAESDQRASMKSYMEEAQAWEDFGRFPADGSLTPYQLEVFQAYKANPRATLREAYLEVRDKKRATAVKESTDPAKVREQVIKELNEASKSPSIPRTGGEVTARQRTRSNRDIVAAALADAESKA